jgi:hypothetical protein
MKVKKLIEKLKKLKQDEDIFYIEDLGVSKASYYFNIYENKIGKNIYYTIEKLEDNETIIQNDINNLEDKFQYCHWVNNLLIRKLNGEKLHNEESELIEKMLYEHNSLTKKGFGHHELE